ncbi:hypothetical protein [Paraburkholderia caledonica]|uniref:Uncharacterized protein n=1 Tax=Paraburkholderia caledonica TaxID=134536 RepID=A0AB73IQJ6_9BURK|nr:hypothetical protein [Paraburkholderia caledonica]
MKRRWITVLLALCCANAFAQADGGDRQSISTVSGTLLIVKLPVPARDGANFNATLNGKPFDRLYGSRYVYYTDSTAEDKPASRIVVEDFVGGFSDAPSVVLYDLRKQPAVALPVSDKLAIDDLRWTASSVVIDADGRWFAFSGRKLTRVRPAINR